MICGLHKQETHECGRDMFQDTTNYLWKICQRKKIDITHSLNTQIHEQKQFILFQGTHHVTLTILFKLRIQNKLSSYRTHRKENIWDGRH